MKNFKKYFLFLFVLSIIFTSFVGFNKVAMASSASVSIVASANPVAFGTPVTFTATPANGGTAPTYQWKKSGLAWNGQAYVVTQVSIPGATGTAYTYSPIDGDIVTVVMTSNLTGVTGSPATSNAITMSITTTPCTGVPTVTYGGKTYNTVLIGTQCWLKQNLNIGTKILGTQDQTNNNVIEKYCYNNLDSNCDIYGGLYNWAETVQYQNGATNTTNWNPVPTAPVRGICPVGWHIPINAEFGTLFTSLGGQSVAGGKLKETWVSHFLPMNAGATNSSGFTALGSGARWTDGTFHYNLSSINLWTTTSGTNPATDVYYGGTAYGTAAALNGEQYKTSSIAVRCIKDSGINISVPDAPTDLTGVFGLFGTSANLSWVAPINNGGSPVTSYKIEYKEIGATTWLSTTSTTTTKIVTGLVAGNSYDYRVSAINSIGTGPSVAITAPSKITSLSATAGNGQVILVWTAPNNGGFPLTNYIIDYKLTSLSTWSSITISSELTTKIITNLTNGQSYDFRIRAWGSSAGIWSDIISKTPVAPPSVPFSVTNLTGAFSVNFPMATLSWIAPTNNGGSPITDYKIEYKLTGATTWIAYSHTPSTNTTITLNSGLTFGASYDYQVSAINAIGTGPAVSITAPSQVTGFTGIAGNGQATLNWNAVNNGGSPLLGYRIRYTQLSGWTEYTFPPTSTSAVITGLTNGQSYDFIVRAWGSSYGPFSSKVNLTPGASLAPVVSTTPSQPDNLTGIFTVDHVDLSWTVPVNNGGLPITSYLIEYRQVSTTTWSSVISTTTSKTISGLLAGNSYEYRVSAINAIGTGPAISITAPSQVTGLTATPSNGKVTLNWATPADGGSPLVEYRMRYKLTGATEWNQVVILSPKSNTYTVTGLVNKSSYDFRVRAVSSSFGPWSSIVSISPLATIEASNLMANTGGAEIISNPEVGTVLKDMNYFTESLSFGKKHAQVKTLQQFLNNYGYPVDAGGAGSLGRETSYFGKATREALVKFQKEKNIYPASGNFGPLTRAAINKIMGNEI